MADKQKYPQIPPMRGGVRARLKAFAKKRGQLFIAAYRDALEAGMRELMPSVHHDQSDGRAE